MTRKRIAIWVGFLVYGLVLFALFTFYRLPADRILSHAVETATDGRVYVSAENVSASLLKGYLFENLTWTIQSEGAVFSERMESLTLSPGFIGLLRGYLPIEVEGVLAKGTFRFAAGVSMIRGLDKGYAHLNAVGVDLSNLAAVAQILQREVKGRFTGQAEFRGSLSGLKNLNGQATILFEKGTVDTRIEALGLGTIPFDKLTLPLTVQNGVASLREGRLVGPVLTGEFEGQIRLQQKLQISPLQITATLRPGPSLAGDKPGGLPGREDKPFVVRLQGTIGKPLFTLSGG